MIKNNWQNRLLYIYNFSKQFPNCGTLKKILQKFIEDLEEVKKEDLESNKENGFDEKLCNCIKKGKCGGLFNSQWLNKGIKWSKIPIHNKQKLQEMFKETAKAEETKIFQKYDCFFIKDLCNTGLEIFRYHHSTFNYENCGFQKSVGADLMIVFMI